MTGRSKPLFWMVASIPTGFAFWITAAVGFKADSLVAQWPFLVAGLTAGLAVHLYGRKVESGRGVATDWPKSVYYGFLFSLLAALSVSVIAFILVPDGEPGLGPTFFTYAAFFQFLWPFCVPSIHFSLWLNRRWFKAEA